MCLYMQDADTDSTNELRRDTTPLDMHKNTVTRRRFIARAWSLKVE